MSPEWIMLFVVLSICIATGETSVGLTCHPCACYKSGKDQVADCSKKNLTTLPTYLPREITVLNVSMNKMKSVDNLDYYEKLVKLDLSHNHLKKLTNFTFVNVSYLKYLDLSYCGIQKIEADSFSVLTKLHTLILSNNKKLGVPGLGRALFSLQNSSLKVLNVNSINFKHGMGVLVSSQDLQYLNRINLEELYCDRNRIEMMEPSAVTELPATLKRLSAKDNKFLFGTYMLELSTLRHLLWADFSMQHTSYIDVFGLRYDTGQFTSNSFGHDVRKRALSGDVFINPWPQNLTISLPPNMTFANFSYSKMQFYIYKINFEPNNLQKLDLSYNYFSKWLGPIEGLNRLEIVDLSNNFCKYIAKDFLQHFPSLKVLNLSSNYLEDTIYSETFQSLTKLEHLDLSDNKLHHLPQGLFQNVLSLRHLNLSLNYLTTWKTPINHLNLDWIDISHNAFEKVPPQLRVALDRTLRQHNFLLYMKNNPLVCDCTTIWSLKWMMDHEILIYNLTIMICHSQNNYKKSLGNLQSILLELKKQCVSYVGIMIGILSIFILILAMTLSGVLFRYRWKLRYLYYLTRFKHRRHHPAMEEGENQFEYDAFISYADEDRRLVIEDMRQRLEEGMGFRLCIHHRDFLPGEAIAANILNAVKSSRKTVVILSSNFLRSSWCKYEVEMAKMEHIYTGRNVLLIVVLEDIPVKDLPSDIMEVMRQDSYIEYTENKNREEQEAFWQSLGRGLRG